MYDEFLSSCFVFFLLTRSFGILGTLVVRVQGGTHLIDVARRGIRRCATDASLMLLTNVRRWVALPFRFRVTRGLFHADFNCNLKYTGPMCSKRRSGVNRIITGTRLV